MINREHFLLKNTRAEYVKINHHLHHNQKDERILRRQQYLKYMCQQNKEWRFLYFFCNDR